MTMKLHKVKTTCVQSSIACPAGGFHKASLKAEISFYPVEDFDLHSTAVCHCTKCGQSFTAEFLRESVGVVYGLVGLIFANNEEGDVANPTILSEYVRMSFCFSAEGFNSEHGQEVSVEMATSAKMPLAIHLGLNQKRPTVLLLKDTVRNRYNVYRWKYADDQDVNEAIVHVADCLVCV